MLMLVSSALKAVYTCTVYTDSQYLVKRLANTRVLEGHHGCVSRVIVYVHVHMYIDFYSTCICMALYTGYCTCTCTCIKLYCNSVHNPTDR